MFWDRPEGIPLTGAERDMQRWMASHEALDAAAAALIGTHGQRAILALAQPGKTRGVWTMGQRVETVPFLALTDDENLHTATAAAERAAAGWLRFHGLTGTVAYVIVGADGHAATFEGFANLEPSVPATAPGEPAAQTAGCPGCNAPQPESVAWGRPETDPCERGTVGCSVRHTRDSECQTW